jgi:hypothetical protein
MSREEGLETSVQELLVEYQAAQDSAQHHDQLIWSITSILWASGLVLLGLVISAMDRPGLRIPLSIGCVLAIAVTAYLWWCVRLMRAIKVQRYDHCKSIEKQLGLKLHSQLVYAAGSQTKWYTWIMLLYLLIWVGVIALIWLQPL